MRSTGSGTDRTEQTATVEQRERSGDPWIRSQEFCDTLYIEKRHQRLRTFISAYSQAEIFPVLITSMHLKELWECRRNENVGELLLTMSRAFPEEFFYERFAAGRGRNPDLYAIGIQPSLIAKLSNEDEQRETPAEDVMPLVA
jgi:hypothetical protein